MIAAWSHIAGAISTNSIKSAQFTKFGESVHQVKGEDWFIGIAGNICESQIDPIPSHFLQEQLF